jgi:hypothetical protein
MRTAVVRVLIDREGTLSAEGYESGLRRLDDSRVEWVASPVRGLPERNREVELIVPGLDRSEVGKYVDLCSDAFGMPAEAGVVTYISRGTDDDAHGVLDAFHLQGEVERRTVDGEEVVTVTLTADALRRTPESRLHTALEAALNCEVRITTGG